MKSETRELTCIGCPLGCQLRAEIVGGAVVKVDGATCENGRRYAHTECTHPVRMLTTTVRLAGCETGLDQPDGRCMLSVRTASPIPKESLTACMKALAGVTVRPPVRMGQTVLTDAAGTGVDIIATEDIGLPAQE